MDKQVTDKSKKQTMHIHQ